MNPVNASPFLRVYREFPEDIRQLGIECNKAYIDTANILNERTIGLHVVNKSVINGESWFLNTRKQQGLRKVFQFTSTADIPLGFKFNDISQFTKLNGVYTDGTSTFGLIPGTSTAISGQIIFYITTGSITSDVIKFVVGAGAPALTSGTIILDWISNP